MNTLSAPPATVFKAYDIRGIVGESLNSAGAYAIGRAIASEARDRGQETIVVGRDGRLSGAEMVRSLVSGLCDSGCEVIDIGLVPTPVLYFATHHLDTGAGVMVTASHNPPDYNGFKIVLGGATLAEGEIMQLHARIMEGRISLGCGKARTAAILPAYITRVLQDISLARSFKVVVDGGNGIAGTVAPDLLRSLGCDVVELYCELDGRFPNHSPDPSQPENLRDLISAVQRYSADVGLAFDGDGDRLGVVDGHGRIIWPDRQLMLYARDVLVRRPGSTVVYDVKCSRHVREFVSRLGGQAIMWKSGHSLVKAKMRKSGACLGGEFSGHIFFKDRWYGFDDGIYTAARLLEILSADERSPADFFASFPDALATPELRLFLKEDDVAELMDALRAHLNFPGARVYALDGIRVECQDGWGLVRASNTMPCLTFRFEADSQKAMERIESQFRLAVLAVAPHLNVPF